MNTISIYPLGDSAMTLDLGNCIDDQLNTRALSINDWLGAHPLEGITDRIVAYSSVSVFYDPTGICDRTAVTKWLLDAWQRTDQIPRQSDSREISIPDQTQSREISIPDQTQPREISIPVCYEGEYAPDLEQVARHTGLAPEELVKLHTSVEYRIYMIGFLPGFPYMGKIDPRLEVPRKARPVPVIAGGVGIAGMQTGVYPLNSPGGWQIIGRTPLRLFDRHAYPPILLRAGDRVRFYPVPTAEFVAWKP